MDPINELGNSLNGYFHWNKARKTCFAKMLLAVIVSRTVNLNKIAVSFASDVAQTSTYRRLQRFFSEFKIDFELLAGFIFGLFFVAGGQWYLTMDRTNWRWGKSDINILMLAIVFKGIAIPIYWELLDKKGNSDTAERIALIQKFTAKFGKNCIAGLLADREFIGNDWMKWLMEEDIPFYIRIKKNIRSTNSRGGPARTKDMFSDLSPTQERVLCGKREIMGQMLFVAGLKLWDGSLLIVATNRTPLDAIKIYGLRWEVETLFACLKGRGFNFEDTHITNQERIKKIVALLAIAFCWAHKTGEWRHEIKPIPIKKHGRLAVSLFRYGLDYLIKIFMNLFKKSDLFKQCLKKFIPLNPGLDGLECYK